MDRQQTMNLTICRRFAEMGIAFAYPTQTLYAPDAARALRVNGHGRPRQADVEESDAQQAEGDGRH